MNPQMFWKGWDAALLYWALKGFKGKYDDELKPDKRKRNIITSTIIWIILFSIYFKYLK